VKNQNVIEGRLFRKSILIAFVLIFVLTGLQVWLDYKDYLSTINNYFQQVEDVQGPGLSTALWNFSLTELDDLTNGITSLPYINYAEVEDQGTVYSQAGEKLKERFIDHEISLIHIENEEKMSIGTLYLQADMREVSRIIFGQVIRLILFQALNVLIVIVFFLILVNREVIRYLNNAAIFFREFDYKHLNRKLSLKKVNRNDELDAMVSSFNEMQGNLIAAFEEKNKTEREHATLLANLPGMAFRSVHDNQWTMELVSKGSVDLTGYTPEEFYQNPDLDYLDLILEVDRERISCEIDEQLKHVDTYEVTYQLRDKQGVNRWVLERGTIIGKTNQGQLVLEGFTIDITERKNQERELEVIANLSFALRSASTKDEILPLLVDQTTKLLRSAGTIIELIDPFSGNTVIEFANGVFKKLIGVEVPVDEGLSGVIRKTGKTYLNNSIKNEPLNLFPEYFENYNALCGVPLFSHEEMIGFLWLVREDYISENAVRVLTAVADIAASAIFRAALFEQTQQRLLRLDGLRKIDVAINNNQDLALILKIVIEQTLRLLGNDKARIFIPDARSYVRVYEADNSSNFSDDEIFFEDIQGTCVEESFHNQQVIMLTENTPNQTYQSCQAKMTQAGYQSLISFPLIAKNEIKGVLQVLRKSPIPLAPDWMGYLEALAGQAAIAISDAHLIRDLTRSNLDLQAAYDKTIEGWSRALDLRDKETEDHTQRVTRLSVALAKECGITGEELINIKRGALLHDIGKVGVPDHILHKPGKLTEEEWLVIQQHPLNAYKLLAPIEYLHNALDIPYCHHEKWDGSGYPRGLRENEIPLAARIFAVTDVWDALTSDRPYRKALPHTETIEYIKKESGSHFDPEIVELFCRYLEEHPDELKEN